FEYVILHEFTHGLGFLTGWSQWTSIGEIVALAPSTQSNFLAPLPSANLSSPTSKVTSWLPLNIFDKYLVDTSTSKSLLNYSSVITSYAPSSQTLQSFLTNFQTTSQYAAAQSVYQIAQTGVRFVSNGLAIHLQGGAYVAGTSIMHLDANDYVASVDFLMIASADKLKGLSLDGLFKRTGLNITGAYGPLTLAVMQALGWPSVTRDVRVSLTLMPSDVTSGVVDGLFGSQLFLIIFSSKTK
ncbi:hypothetical protein HK096_004565, partial [Nowakowskiella sp. JEL0078]